MCGVCRGGVCRGRGVWGRGVWGEGCVCVVCVGEGCVGGGVCRVWGEGCVGEGCVGGGVEVSWKQSGSCVHTSQGWSYLPTSAACSSTAHPAECASCPVHDGCLASPAVGDGAADPPYSILGQQQLHWAIRFTHKI